MAGIKAVRQYFANKDAPLRLLRNKLGFHQDVALAKQSLNGIADTEMVDYRGRYFATTLFMSAETLHLRALAILFGMESSRDALNLLADHVQRMLSEFYRVCQGYHDWFMALHVIPVFGLENGQTIPLDDAPKADDIVTPFFVNFDDVKARVDAQGDAPKPD